MEQINIGDTGD